MYWNTTKESQLISRVTRYTRVNRRVKKRRKKKRYHQRSARVCCIHMHSANQLGHEISKTNVNQTGHQTVAELTWFYSTTGAAGHCNAGDRFLRASTMCAFRRVTPIHADTKNTLSRRKEEEREKIIDSLCDTPFLRTFMQKWTRRYCISSNPLYSVANCEVTSPIRHNVW